MYGTNGTKPSLTDRGGWREYHDAKGHYFLSLPSSQRVSLDTLSSPYNRKTRSAFYAAAYSDPRALTPSISAAQLSSITNDLYYINLGVSESLAFSRDNLTINPSNPFPTLGVSEFYDISHPFFMDIPLRKQHGNYIPPRIVTSPSLRAIIESGESSPSMQSIIYHVRRDERDFVLSFEYHKERPDQEQVLILFNRIFQTLHFTE